MEPIARFWFVYVFPYVWPRALMHDGRVAVGRALLCLLYIGLACYVAECAGSKGRTRVAWFWYGVLLLPIALPHVVLMRARFKRTEIL